MVLFGEKRVLAAVVAGDRAELRRLEFEYGFDRAARSVGAISGQPG
jgi:hypothetical protein